MKRFKVILAVSLVFLMMFLLSVPCLAMSTGFSVEDFSEEELVRVKKNIVIRKLENEPIKQPFDCFDVNVNGQIAVGFHDSQYKTVCVYNADGEFQYGFEFETYGSNYVEWGGDNLNIIFVRSDIIVSVDSNGNVLDYKSIKETTENGRYVREYLTSNRRDVDKTTYLIKNDIGILNWVKATYSQIVVKNSSGEKIVYDVSPEQFARTIFWIVIVCCVFIGFVVSLYKQVTKQDKTVKQGDQSRDGSVIDNL